MGAYKRDVVVVIKMGAYIHGVLILCGCLLSRFYGSSTQSNKGLQYHSKRSRNIQWSFLRDNLSTCNVSTAILQSSLGIGTSNVGKGIQVVIVASFPGPFEIFE